MIRRVFNNLCFDALRSAFYHTERAAFFRNVNRGLLFSAIFFGASAAAKAAGLVNLNGVWLDLLVVFIAALLTVCGFEARAADHAALQARCYEILAEIDSGRPLSKAAMDKGSAKLMELSGQEATAMRAVNALAYNKALEAFASNDDELRMYRRRVRWWHLMFRHVCAFHTAEFPARVRTLVEPKPSGPPCTPTTPVQVSRIPDADKESKRSTRLIR
jgi:hypothetical protein